MNEMQPFKPSFFNIANNLKALQCMDSFKVFFIRCCMSNHIYSLQLTVSSYFTGQLYVMMSPQEVLTGSNQRTIAPRTQPYIA